MMVVRLKATRLLVTLKKKMKKNKKFLTGWYVFSYPLHSYPLIMAYHRNSVVWFLVLQQLLV